ncbi:MAG: HepT-like ribonuclease domain-containing protein [Flavisolibacter sp.]
MSKEPVEFLKHIADECAYLLSVSKDLSKESFLDDETLKRAVVRSLEIIGEATKKVPDDFKVKWNSIQWRNMAGMRDRLIHDYIGVNYSIVWDVFKNKIPELYDQIQHVLKAD